MKNSYPTFRAGQKVVTIYGKTREVLLQRGCQVFLVGEPSWFHPTKVFRVTPQGR